MARAGFPRRTITSQPKNGAVIDVEVPTHIVSLLEFHNGATGQLTTSFDVRHGNNSPAIEIYGSKGSLSVPDPNGTDGPVKLRTNKYTDWVQIRHTHPHADDVGTRGVGVADMAVAIAGKRPHRANEGIAMHALDIMQAIHESSAAGRHIELQSTCARPEAMPAINN
jgi:predicted dehydrogenase